MAWIVPLILLAIFAIAVRFGADSRDGRDWARTDVSGRNVRDMVSSCC